MKPAVTQTNRTHVATHGESYGSLLGYFVPEYVSSLLLYWVLIFIDGLLLSQVHVSFYATNGFTNTLFHLVTKVAEAFSVGIVVLCGQYNGVGDHKKVGQTAVDGFWLTCVVGGLIALLLYVGAYWLYWFLEVPEHIRQLGVPFLRLRAIGIFFNFVFFALVGFLRSIKNTRVPMVLYMLGGVFFIFFDWALIFGKCGFSCMGFQGSACASVIQYGVMLAGALGYVLYSSELRPYGIRLLNGVHWNNIYKLVMLSWPVMIDKASIAVCNVWLAKMINSVANQEASTVKDMVCATFTTIKDVDRFAIIPGLAFAQVITFLVSNDFKIKNWSGIAHNLRRILILSVIFVFSIIILFTLFPEFFVSLVDKHGTFTQFAINIIPYLGIFVLFDLLQLILSAALRGAADVKTVMWARVLLCGFFFFPVSYGITLLPIENIYIKFMLIYGSLHAASALMSIIYIVRLRGGAWQKAKVT